MILRQDGSFLQPVCGLRRLILKPQDLLIMRPLKFYLFAILISLLLSSGKLHADHFLGGEITWTCLGSGQYKFQVVYYRDCTGQDGPLSVVLLSNVPGVYSLNLPKIAQTDISPNGYQAGGDTSCLNCPAATPSTWSTASLIEKLTYESAAITLPGIPPPSGWVFWYEDCCRNTIANNVSYAGQFGYVRLEARMYPTGNQTAGICDDSSPVFVETPSFMSCIGINKELQHLAIDADDDFMVYEFTSALADSGLALPMQSGYTVSQPLPGITQDPNNIVTNMNMFNGEVRLKSFTNGRFVLNVKVTSYRGAVITSEIRRSYDLVITSNCNPILGNASNLPPVWEAPFLDTATSTYTIFEDTVFAGDVVNFTKGLLEFEQFGNGNYQQGYFSVAGSQFGTNFSSDSTGCLYPPCATINIPVPASFMFAQTFTFNWQTSIAHLNTIGWNPAKTYYFLFRASDNYCPVNGSKARIVSITVVDSTVGFPVSQTNEEFHILPTASVDGAYQIVKSNNLNLKMNVVVSDITGKVVWMQSEKEVPPGTHNLIDLSNQSRGMYFVNINGSVQRILKL